ncbi:hypothetical protein GGR42_000612 [Saonia flava]|uniref:Lipid/polyisoprenoid-binding YceI-like domain-containing protein n=1 Tax=Saonia flava TaxID=523696 RepID=A0A846QT64_9FLAO|nr:YceI family protein [Saonia flava]NJB70150.1 hypothetical protein [Saonia flava]
MNKLIKFLFVFSFFTGIGQNSEQIIARQGQVSFFSYTSVENIKAENNQALSIIDFSNNKIAASMLMNAFIFEKALMKEHFNESYIESDIHPKATFEGEIIDFDASINGIQTKMVQGIFTLHGISKELEIKTDIDSSSGKFVLTGTFETFVKDYDIKVPPLLAGNIAKTISVTFRFEYEPYEK